MQPNGDVAHTKKAEVVRQRLRCSTGIDRLIRSPDNGLDGKVQVGEKTHRNGFFFGDRPAVNGPGGQEENVGSGLDCAEEGNKVMGLFVTAGSGRDLVLSIGIAAAIHEEIDHHRFRTGRTVQIQGEGFVLGSL